MFELIDPKEERILFNTVRLLEMKLALTKDTKEMLPEELCAKLKAASSSQRNSRGEPLAVQIVKYISDPFNQEHMLSIVAEDMSNSCNSLDSNFGGNLNCTDDRELRTPLMWACALGNAYVASSLLMYTNAESFMMQDRLGNTCVMYAAISGLDTVIEIMVFRVMSSYNWTVLRTQNMIGHTAEELAIRNGNHRCARVLQTHRLHMVACLDRQLREPSAAPNKHWEAFRSVYKCAERWKQAHSHRHVVSDIRHSTNELNVMHNSHHERKLSSQF